MRHPFEEWLEYLDSHNGRLHRREQGGNETDYDIAALIPIPPGRRIFTVGDLRKTVELIQKGKSNESDQARRVASD